MLQHVKNVSTGEIPEIVPQLDKVISLNLLIGLVFGVPANILSLYYFTRLCKGRDLPTSLYRRIVVVDLMTCLAHLPVMLSMWSGRDPVLFGNHNFCIAWRVIFRGLQLLAIFLVLLLSLTRTIAICLPFATTNKKAVLWSFWAYLLILVLQNATLRSEQIHVYDEYDVYCYEDLGTKKMFGKIDDQLYELEIIIPSFIIIASFVCSVYKLRKTNVVTATDSQSNNKQASVTIMIVTGIFLTCHLPQCINMLIWIIDYEKMLNYSKPIYQNVFMKFYTWNISAVQTVVLNAYLGPVVYYSRMQRFRDWAHTGFAIPSQAFLQRCSFSSIDHVMRNRVRSLVVENTLPRHTSSMAELFKEQRVSTV